MYVRNQIYENVDDVTNDLNDQTEQLKDIDIIRKNMSDAKSLETWKNHLIFKILLREVKWKTSNRFICFHITE